jgi:hypothetical protein
MSEIDEESGNNAFNYQRHMNQFAGSRPNTASGIG